MIQSHLNCKDPVKTEQSRARPVQARLEHDTIFVVGSFAFCRAEAESQHGICSGPTREDGLVPTLNVWGLALNIAAGTVLPSNAHFSSLPR